MEVKDWILLMTPIIINGLILYWFQLLISEKIKQNTAKKELMKNIYERYMHLADKALGSFRNSLVVLVNSENIDEQSVANFNAAITQLRQDIRNLQYYYQDYKIILGESNELTEKYNQLDKEFRAFNSGETVTAISFLHKGESLLQEILKISLDNMIELC